MIARRQATTKRAADSAINNQPLHEEEEDLTSWLTPAFLAVPKRKTRNKLGSLLPILYPLSFSWSHKINTYKTISSWWLLFFIVWPTYFLSYRGILHMYFWYSKKKGVNVDNPRHKNTVPGLVLCCHDREMLAKSANIWLSGWHVTNMLPTFPAKLMNEGNVVIVGVNPVNAGWNEPNPTKCLWWGRGPAEILRNPYSTKSPLPSVDHLAVAPKLTNYWVFGQSRIQRRHITCSNHPRIHAQ